jgi:spore coat polysaccharide biosynthesis protein SpsF
MRWDLGEVQSVKVVAIIQARLGSQRLPGKVLMDICGKPALQRTIERTKRASLVDEVMVATTVRDEDDIIAEVAEACAATVFRGSSSDVLLRYVNAAGTSAADIICRITADCPLVDPEIIDKVIMQLGRADYCSNVVKRTYPRGLDVEVMHRDVLERAERLATSQPAREHVTLTIYEEHPSLFQIRHVLDTEDNSDLNFCLDYAADLVYLRRFWEDTDYRTLIGKARSLSRFV